MVPSEVLASNNNAYTLVVAAVARTALSTKVKDFFA